MNAATSGLCSGLSCTAKKLGSQLQLRYGRLRLDDAFGPESVLLPVNFYTEYWTGSFFDEADDDSCTKILRSAISYPSGNILTPANLAVTLAGGATRGEYASINATEINFSQGNAGHYFQKPSGAGTGSFGVDVDLSSYPWLRFDWNQNGNFNDDLSLPRANFGFGQYRGHDRIIYWRERFQ
jgi:MSHA biogenesis protein MshQ